MREIKISPEFKNHTIKAVLAIALFLLTYLLMLILAIGLTVLCFHGGIMLFDTFPGLFNLVIGLGMTSTGVLVFFFLLKFTFKRYKIDRSNLIEVKQKDEPILFNLIEEIVKEIDTSFPKKIYVSSDVNAAVFFDSSFYSMLFPTRKNLQIGLGLVNAVTHSEFKAILAHEFGHFSQKTLSVGSYVYHINMVINSLLIDNESFRDSIKKWENTNAYFFPFVIIASLINEGIKLVLKQMYIIVNKSYMALSREMEFHADAIAASVTGYEPVKNSLLRMAFADNTFSTVLNFYNDRISENVKSNNLYKDHSLVMNFLAELNSIPKTNGLPNISLEEQSKYNKSKLVIKDQWASHPTTTERISRLEKTCSSKKYDSDLLANSLFSDIIKTQKKITNNLFESVYYEGATKAIEHEKFLEEYKREVLSNSFSKIYNGYYDSRNPVNFDLKHDADHPEIITKDELFSDEIMDIVHSSISLKNDIQTLTDISNKTIFVKTFDYNGVRFNNKDAGKLIEELSPQLERINELLKANDLKIYKYFSGLEEKLDKAKELKQLYKEFFDFDKLFDSKYEIYTDLLNDLKFTSVTTRLDKIRTNFKKIKIKEELLKIEINQLLADEILIPEITDEIRELMERYTSTSLDYFGVAIYNDDNLNLLYSAIHNYGHLLTRKYFLMKRRLLTYQVGLIENQSQHAV